MRTLKRSRHQIGADVFWGIAIGLAMATFYSIIAVTIYVLRAGAPFHEAGIGWGVTLGAYWVGGAVGGVLLGLLRPLTRNNAGAVFAGILVAIPVFTAIAVALADISWIAVLICAVIFGTMGGIVFSGHDRTPSEFQAIDQRVDEIDAHVARLGRARERERARRRPMTNGGSDSPGRDAV